MFVLLFLLSLTDSYASNKYDHAIKVSAEAFAKQVGLEGDFIKVKGASTKAVKKWAIQNGLSVPLTAISFVAPVIYKRKVRIKTGNFVFNANANNIQLDWKISY